MGRMSTVHLIFRTLVCLVACLLAPSMASALELKPFKDDLFAYPGILESKDNGDWIKVDYRKERDIYQRDDEPERKVNGNMFRWASPGTSHLMQSTWEEGASSIYSRPARSGSRNSVWSSSTAVAWTGNSAPATSASAATSTG